MINPPVTEIFDTVFDTIKVFSAIHTPDTFKIINLGEKNSFPSWQPLLVSGSIGILALLVSLWSLHVNNANNKRSKEPYLNLFFRMKSNSITGVSIANKGIGPAIMHSIDYSFGEKRITGTNPISLSNPGKPFLQEINSFGQITFTSLTEGAYIAVGESMDLIQIEGSNITNAQICRFIDILKQIDFVIHYRTSFKEARKTRSSNVALTQLYGSSPTRF